MLAVQKSSQRASDCAPNVLPCKIAHDGPVKAKARYWSPQFDDDGMTATSYFRGRKLRGRRVNVPDGYRGAVLMSTDRFVPASQDASAVPAPDFMDTDGHGANEEEKPPEVKAAEEVASFREMIIWEHGRVPDERGDPYLKAMHEWMALASVAHSEGSS
ncbi:ribonuclease H2, subunit C [Lineolata rhizophorae]|uniref:Ribonuclease H2, subunit C n=1 Tax=Lineolata rhizophorae TaxID=578093 RepID=A0A6A6P625_9PEZI|nr:ribonuclease H2, subunit C [Lineolata rhizophorae]